MSKILRKGEIFPSSSFATICVFLSKNERGRHTKGVDWYLSLDTTEGKIYSECGMTKFSLIQFLKKYPTDDVCLDEIKLLMYPDGIFCTKCEKVTTHYKLKGRTAYSCEFCRKQVFPLAGTIFEKTSTPLRLWFYAMYLMTQTRSGISAKQLERELGVTYKTAWRMFKQIRTLMAESGGSLLQGDVEIDETFVGGKGVNRRNEWRDSYTKPKEVLMGMVEREGKVYIKHVPNTGKWTLLTQIKQNVSPKARIHTDEWMAYKNLHKFGYLHDAVNHSALEYVKGDIYTNNIENVWSHLKRGVNGVYRIVSKKYLQAYADEYAFRYNHRRLGGEMFNHLLKQVATVKVVSSSQLA